jgi:hypothetical protein
MMMIGNGTSFLNNFISHRCDGVWYNDLEEWNLQYSYALPCNV